MASTGLLLLTSVNRLRALLAAASKHVSRTLYVHLQPANSTSSSVEKEERRNGALPNNLLRCVSALYSHSSAVCSHLDVRVLLGSFKGHLGPSPATKTMPEVVLTDARVRPDQLGPYSRLPIFRLLDEERTEVEERASQDAEGTFRVYDKVVIGGTFDRLHNGHKTLLSEALMRCAGRLTVGVTDGPMLHSKVLWELIQPVELRTRLLREFLEDVDPSVSYDLEPITDPFGPSVTDKDLECIVVSRETVNGGRAVNVERRKKGMSELDLHTVDLVQDELRNEREEAKVSSSSTRIRLLGTQLRQPTPKPHLPKSPYVVGLTGGIASGKSSIAAHAQGLGAAVVNCDRLGHEAYRKGAPVLDEIVAEFGKDVLDPKTGDVDRKRLGSKVFASREKLEKLNELVWPHVRRLALEEVRRLADGGARVVVLEAALLLEAAWEEMVHEVWVAIVPRDEAVKRIQARDSLDEDQALRRVTAQSSNLEKVRKADVVFSTSWEPEFTLSQVTKAWDRLMRHLQED